MYLNNRFTVAELNVVDTESDIPTYRSKVNQIVLRLCDW